LKAAHGAGDPYPRPFLLQILEVRDALDEERLPFLGRKDLVTDMNLMCKAPLLCWRNRSWVEQSGDVR